MIATAIRKILGSWRYLKPALFLGGWRLQRTAAIRTTDGPLGASGDGSAYALIVSFPCLISGLASDWLVEITSAPVSL